MVDSPGPFLKKIEIFYRYVEDAFVLEIEFVPLGGEPPIHIRCEITPQALKQLLDEGNQVLRDRDQLKE